ncbi:MAG: calcium-binding protein [Hyphomonadaceae bacterium]|nr:calcium-binding protein [Hyphomonadaceae bacterium]
MANAPVTWLEEFLANTTTAGIQSDPDIIQLANGNLLVAWTSNSDTGAGANAGTDLVAQIFDPLGNAVGGEFALNTAYFADDERDVDITALADGGFLITFLDDEGANGVTLRMEHYDSTGARTNLAAVALDTDTNFPTYDGARVAVSSATSAMFIYRELGVGSATNGDIYFRIYDPSTQTLGAASLAISSGTDELSSPDIVVLSNGNYAIVAESSDGRLLSRVLDPGGSNVDGANFITGTGGVGVSDSAASVTALAGGGMLVSFTRTTVTGDAVYVTILNATADQVLAPTLVSASGDEAGGSVALGLGDGSFIVAYSNSTDGQLIAAHYDSAGVFLGQTVVADITGIRNLSGVAQNDGRFTLTWNSGGDIYTEILDARDLVSGPAYTPDSWQVGTVGDDTFSGSAAIVHGYAGDDNIVDGSGANAIFGDAGDDILNIAGVSNLESLDGGDGTDTVRATGIVDGTIFDLDAGTATNGVVVEAITNFENVVGSGSDEFIYGTGGANRLEGGEGVDVIDGRGGIDTLIGGGGIDDLTGGGGGDTLNGGNGGDTMTGGAGNDTYIVNSGSDLTIETVNGGVDLVQSSVNRTLSVFVENLTLTGTAANGTGNDLDNVITGNASANTLRGLDGGDTLSGGGAADTLVGGNGQDTLIGGNGQDTLTGGGGADKFLLNAAPIGANADTITDFATASDKIQLENAAFTAIVGTGTLTNAQFWASANAHDADDRILYDGATGNLYYDSNGNAAGAKVLIATLDPGLTITNTDFQVI